MWDPCGDYSRPKVPGLDALSPAAEHSKGPRGRVPAAALHGREEGSLPSRSLLVQVFAPEGARLGKGGRGGLGSCGNVPDRQTAFFEQHKGLGVRRPEGVLGCRGHPMERAALLQRHHEGALLHEPEGSELLLPTALDRVVDSQQGASRGRGRLGEVPDLCLVREDRHCFHHALLLAVLNDVHLVALAQGARPNRPPARWAAIPSTQPRVLHKPGYSWSTCLGFPSLGAIETSFLHGSLREYEPVIVY